MKSDLYAKAIAQELRSDLGFNLTEAIDIYKVLQLLNITCIKRQIDKDTISGLTLIAPFAQIILVNSRCSLGHQNFTIAHELYHCLYDKNIHSQICEVDVYNTANIHEKTANKFAKYLLMPDEAIIKHIQIRKMSKQGLRWHDIINMEIYFGVSHKSFLIRLNEMKILNKKQVDSFKDNVIQAANIFGKDTSLYKPTLKNEFISDYIEKAQLALNKDLITYSKFEQFLGDAGLLEEYILAESNDNSLEVSACN